MACSFNPQLIIKMKYKLIISTIDPALFFIIPEQVAEQRLATLNREMYDMAPFVIVNQPSMDLHAMADFVKEFVP
jgi:hypothetical protein